MRGTFDRAIDDRDILLQVHTIHQVSEDIAVSTSRAILEAISRGDGPDETLIALGYAGWSAGQLEEEMQHNAWLSGPAAPELLFHVAAERRWHDAAALLGVDLALLSGDVGHA
jgi:putative transcriptional regulator